MRKGLTLAAAVLFVTLGLATISEANPVNLGTAGPGSWVILGLGGDLTGTQTDISLNTATNVGNVGIAAKGTGNPSSDLHVSGCCAGAAIITGNVFLDTNATLSNSGNIQGSAFANNSTGQATGTAPSGGVFVNGTVHTTLGQAVTDAENFAALYAALACTICGITNVDTNSGTTTITGVNGTNVVNLTDLKLNGDSTKLLLTATGANAQFIVNVSGTFNLSGGDIILGGDLTPDEVLINYTGTTDLHTSGPSAFINGILLAEHANIGFSNAIINGEVIAGGSSVQIVSGSFVQSGVTVPEPGTGILISLGVVGVALVARRMRSQRSA